MSDLFWLTEAQTACLEPFPTVSLALMIGAS